MSPTILLFRDLGQFLRQSRLNVLLIFVPISLILELAHAWEVWVFAAAALAIVPLAGLIGQATEEIAEHTGPGLGGFLNATFGNATELIIAFFAVREGLYEVVKASITGSILGNMLLVLGLSMLAGGWKREKQTFNRVTAGASSAMLMLAVTALVMPAVWDLVVTGSLTQHNDTVNTLSLLTVFVLLATYGASLMFSLVTHRELFAAVGHELAHKPKNGLSVAIVVLSVATAFTALEAEFLVGTINVVGAALGLTELFIGIIIVAVVGNAAEHMSAIVMARKGNMDLAFQIAIGSSTQIALLVAPVLVLVSFLFGSPMDLLFNPFEIVALGLAVLSVAMVSLDGESNWFEGVQLVAVYLVLALAFYFVPA
ncbi:MAG: calcium/proton exchanger [Dehalococcoidia bacterium]|nr:calcium/proton exchanger [Dehalococcoidia bacterium]